MGGNVTASFPEELVVFEASSDRNYDELINLIKDRISSYPCSCGDFIEITPHAKYNVTLDSSTMRQFIYEVHDWINGQGEYWLNFSIYTNEHEIFLNFLCEAIYYDSLILDKRGRIFRKELFNRTIEMNLSQTILIGFAPPKAQNGYRGSAYWFIISKPGDTVLSFILSVDTFFQKLA